MVLCDTLWAKSVSSKSTQISNKKAFARVVLTCISLVKSFAYYDRGRVFFLDKSKSTGVSRLVTNHPKHHGCSCHNHGQFCDRVTTDREGRLKLRPPTFEDIGEHRQATKYRRVLVQQWRCGVAEMHLCVPSPFFQISRIQNLYHTFPSCSYDCTQTTVIRYFIQARTYKSTCYVLQQVSYPSTLSPKGTLLLTAS